MVSVLVVDDSALIRSILTDIIQRHPKLTLAGAAPDAFVAKKMVNDLDIDVITLDIEMPKVNGLTFLDRLMKARPKPVLMFSTLTEQGADATILALELGAVDFVPKPKLDVQKSIQAFEAELTEKILAASRAKVQKRNNSVARKNIEMQYTGTELIVGIGASTGGCEAIKSLVVDLPASFPAIVIAQHMPPRFTKSFAKRLNNACKMTVLEAQHNERILPGHIYISPGDHHFEIVRSGSDYRIALNREEKVSGHRPSVDVMMHSLAKNVGKNALGIMLTGMGKDGALGLKAMHQAGSHTIAQSENTCVVFGMPKEAIQQQAVSEIADLDDITNRTLSWVAKNSKGGRF